MTNSAHRGVAAIASHPSRDPLHPRGVASPAASGDWVQAAPFRAHLHCLVADTGLPPRVVAVAAGVPPRVVDSLLRGRRGTPVQRIRSQDARMLLALTRDRLRVMASTRVAPSEASQRVLALRAAGLPDAAIARWLLLSVHEVAALASGEVQPDELTAVRAAAACSALGMDGWLAGARRQPDEALTLDLADEEPAAERTQALTHWAA